MDVVETWRFPKIKSWLTGRLNSSVQAKTHFFSRILKRRNINMTRAICERKKIRCPIIIWVSWLLAPRWVVLPMGLKAGKATAADSYANSSSLHSCCSCWLPPALKPSCFAFTDDEEEEKWERKKKKENMSLWANFSKNGQCITNFQDTCRLSLDFFCVI